ncbi:MAG: glycoside hydrolase family 3 protein, partial [Bacteroidetes bacterium]|nr:glycoside hydrolase family 3 protein [Bacteroidota bacterium]
YEITASKDFGVEDLTPPEKVRDAILAGIDQFGGESVPEYVIELVESGRLEETRIDQSVKKLLRLKFELGLFDNPYVDEDEVANRVGTPEFKNIGYQSQLRSQVLLTNKQHDNSPILPLDEGVRVYLQNMSSEPAERFAEVVDQPEEADVIIVNLEPPHEPGAAVIAGIEIFRQGRLYYTDEELQPLLDLMQIKPTVVTMYLERPFVIPEIIDRSSAALAHFGSSEEAIFDVIFGEFNPEGTLPFQMPSNWESVLTQAEDQPFDLEDPLFDFGHGLSYD